MTGQASCFRKTSALMGNVDWGAVGLWAGSMAGRLLQSSKDESEGRLIQRGKRKCRQDLGSNRKRKRLLILIAKIVFRKVVLIHTAFSSLLMFPCGKRAFSHFQHCLFVVDTMDHSLFFSDSRTLLCQTHKILHSTR